MERVLATLLLALIACAAPAQVLARAPAPEITPALAADGLSFTELEQRMTVPVQIAGAGPYRFIIDTGAQRSASSHDGSTCPRAGASG